MFLLRMLMKRGKGGSMDPLQVSMTGVRMGERFLQIGCHDRNLLGGLAAKVGLSGTAAVAAFNAEHEKRAAGIGKKIGALIDIKDIDQGRAWPFAASEFDMIVVDDTGEEFRALDDRARMLRNALSSVRPGGRIEVVTSVKTAHEQVDFVPLLNAAGFKPVRILAERNGLRFVEGLRPNS